MVKWFPRWDSNVGFSRTLCLSFNFFRFYFEQDEGLDRLVSESESLKERFGHYFDLTIRNHNIDDTIEELLNSLNELEKPQWVPTSWLY